MTIREFRAGNNKFVIENEKDKIFTLKCYEGGDFISEKSYAKECYALSALRNKNNGELPEEVTGQTSDLIEVFGNDIIVRKPKLSDVISEDQLIRLEMDNELHDYMFTLNGHSEVRLKWLDHSNFLLIKEGVEKKYKRYVLADYITFIRQILYPETDFELSFEDLYLEEQTKVLQEKISNVGNGYLDLVITLRRFTNVHNRNGFFVGYEYHNIYSYSEKYLGMGRTSTKNLLAISEKFVERDVPKFKSGFENYSYSQLTELCSVDDDKLIDFTPDMTIKQMREKKKEFKEDSKQKIDEKGEKLTTVRFYASNIKNNNPWRNKFQKQEINEDNFYEMLYEYCDKEFAATDYYLKGGYGDKHITFFEFVTGCLSFMKQFGELCLLGVVPGFNTTFHNISCVANGLIKNGYVNNPVLRIKEKEDEAIQIQEEE